MAEAKKPLIKVMTPQGIAKFPTLTKPDTKFKADGEYKCGVVLPLEKAQPIIDKIIQLGETILAETKVQLEAAVAEAKGEKLVKAKKALAELKLGDWPFKPVYDEEGNETGEVAFNFKMNAQHKDKKTQKIITMFPKLFDAAGNPMNFNPSNGKQVPCDDVWGGSTVKVSGSLNPFYIPGTNTCGVGLRLAAVQVIQLRSGGGGDASTYGFGKEDGYEAPQSAAAEEGFGDESGGSGEDSGTPDF